MHSSAAMDNFWTVSCSLILVMAAVATALISEIHYDLTENTGIGYSVGNLQTSAASSGGSEYKFSNGSNCTKYLNLFPSGEIQTKINIDREFFIETTNKDTMTCVVEYKSAGSNTKQSIIVTIAIKDVNDVIPRFFGLQQPEDNRTAYENLMNGSIVLYLMPYDLDNGDNGTVDFSIIKGNEENYFKLRSPVTGDSSNDKVLCINNELDYEHIPEFNLTFKISDHGNPPLVSYQHLLIHVIDVNDQDPTFTISQFYFDVPEDHPIGRDHPFGRVNASDQDSPTHAQIFYLLKESSDTFEVNITTGELYLIQSLDYDRGTTTMTFSVVARNPGMKVGTTAEIEVGILDVNDEVPFLDTINPMSIYENTANVTLFHAIYKDLDKESPNNQINESISVSLSPPISFIIASTKAFKDLNLFVITIAVNEALDREITPVLNMTFIVSDSGSNPLTSSTTISIEVLDLNDNAPQFTLDRFSGKALEVSIPDRYILTVTAVDPDLGVNAEFQFSISKVAPVDALDWFSINASTGDVYLVKQPSYSKVQGLVEVFVTATDNAGNSNTTVVEISIIPPFTFEPNSFQNYSNIDLIGSSTVYIEFRTDDYNSSQLILYQRSSEQQSVEAYLQLIGSKIVYSNGSQQIETTFEFQPNKWYSVLIEMMNDIQVWEKGTDVNSEAIRLLQTTALGLCSEQTATLPSSVVSVGGVSDIFDIILNGGGASSMIDTQSVYDFHGEISTVIIEDRQLDMSCPLRQKGVVSGSHFDGLLCTQFTDTCNPKYTSCVSYIEKERDVCQCKLGFPSDSCDDEEDYNPISMVNGTHVQFTLGYDYFFSAYQQRLDYSGDPNVAQTISISFTPGTDSPAGVLFYSKTKQLVNVLEIDQTLRYIVRDTTNYAQVWNRISEIGKMTKGTEYTVVIQLLSTDDLVSMWFGETNKELRLLEPSKATYSTLSLPYKFVEQPTTAVSIGGLTDSNIDPTTSPFEGCVTQFSIDGAPFPLNNFIRTRYLDTTVVGMAEDLSLSCHACYNNTECSTGHTCTIIGSLNDQRHTCTCDRSMECIEPTTTGTPVPVTTVTPMTTGTDGGHVTGGVENPSESDKIGLNVIIGISAGGLFVVVLAVVLLTLIVRCAYVKGKKKRSFKFVTQVTYHQKDDSQTEPQDLEPIQMTRLAQNNYIDTPIKHMHCPSTDDSAIDGVVHSPSSLRESTSQETGFHTASEFDPPSRQSSPRRTYNSSSGKSSSEQYDSDIETDSESLNTCDSQSPHVLHMAQGGGVPMANGSVPMHYPRKKPSALSSKERLALTPLHPNSAALLLTEDDTGSEVSTTTNTTNRHFDDESIISTGHKWYKSSSPSTIVSNEGNDHMLPPVPPTHHAHNPHYHSHTLDSYYKKSKRNKLPPGTFRPHKSNSPPHYYVTHNGHSPHSTSPLVQKAHRFEYPPYNTRGPHYENVDPAAAAGMMVPPPGLSPKLPVIDESGQYIHHPPPPAAAHYHVRQHSDHSYLDNMSPPVIHHPQPHPAQVHPDMMNPLPPYYPGYQGTNLTPGGGTGTKYCDLNSFAEMNPITYWEQQQRLRPTVDDGLNFLMEPYTKFEDVSTTPSVVESTVIDGDDESMYNGAGPVHEYGTRRPITSRGLHDMYPPSHIRNGTIPLSSNTSSQVSVPTRLSKIPRSRSRNSERSPKGEPPTAIVSNGIASSQEDLTGTQEGNGGTGYPITHFPSADCHTPTFLSHHHDDNAGNGGMLDSTSTLAAPVDLSDD